MIERLTILTRPNDDLISAAQWDHADMDELDIEGHRGEEMKSIYTALYAKMLELSLAAGEGADFYNPMRRVALYKGEDPYRLEVFMETRDSGMLLAMNQAITHLFGDGECIYMAENPEHNDLSYLPGIRYTNEGRRLNNHKLKVFDRTETISLKNKTKREISMRAGLRNRGFGSFMVDDYGFSLPAPLTEWKADGELSMVTMNKNCEVLRYIRTDYSDDDFVDSLRMARIQLNNCGYNGDVFLDVESTELLESPIKTHLVRHETGETRQEMMYHYNLVSLSSDGVVYEKDHDILEGFGVAVLYECNISNVAAQMQNIHKMSPAGWLEFHVQADSGKLRHGFRVVNEQPSETKNPTRGTLNPVFARSGKFEVAGRIDYRTWYEIVKSKETRRGANYRGLGEESQRILGLEPHFEKEERFGSWNREIIGLTNDGQIVFGYANIRDEGNEYALIKFGTGAIFDQSCLRGNTSIERKETVEIGSPTESVELECLERWLPAARQYCLARGRDLDETNVKAVFAAYINSGVKVTEEDIEDFNQASK
jgi:hypothetical protein